MSVGEVRTTEQKREEIRRRLDEDWRDPLHRGLLNAELRQWVPELLGELDAQAARMAADREAERELRHDAMNVLTVYDDNTAPENRGSWRDRLMEWADAPMSKSAGTPLRDEIRRLRNGLESIETVFVRLGLHDSANEVRALLKDGA